MQALALSILPVINVLGYVVLIFSATMLIPLAFAFGAGEATQKGYDLSLLITAAIGGFLLLSTRRFRRELQPRDGFLLVTLGWTVLPACATLPLLLHMPGLSFTDAYFETMSGLTTTGATVLTGLDQLPLSINVWRHLLVWLGGMGILVLVVAILPLLGVGGAQMFRAETAGPFKESKLTPRIADTAKALYSVYLGISLVCFFAYRWAGMTWSDAFMHMCSTMGLGGFSSHDASFGYFESPLIDYTAVVFMAIAGFNFSLHFIAWRRRSLVVYLTDPEARAYLVTLVLACLAIAAFLYYNEVYAERWQALRYATFNVVSIATTTGYANTDYNQWPIFAPIFMLFLCGFATCAGSTGGGVKMIRGLILLKQARREMTRILHPRSVSPVVVGDQAIDNKVIFAVLAFMLIYGASITWLTFLLLLSGLDVISAFTAIVACINNTGPGLNQVGPATNYGGLNDFETWVCTFAMLIGRLELFSVLVLLTPEFWRR
jgi:trk/ktr system potassium uptake protein